MFGGTIQGGRKPIGIELGDGVIRMAQLGGGRRGLRLLAARRRPLPQRHDAGGNAYTDAVREAMIAMLHEGGFVGRRVVSSLPPSAVHYKNLRLPAMPPPELAEAVRWEAAERLKEVGPRLVTQYLDAGDIRQGDEIRREVIAIAIDEAHVEKHVQLLESCGLQPACVEVTASALGRIAGHAPSDDNGPQVILSIQPSSTEVLIVIEGQVQFCKTIMLGLDSVDEAIARMLQISEPEAVRLRCALGEPGVDAKTKQDVLAAAGATLDDLGREIGLCLRYYGVTFRGRRPSSAALVGSVSGQPWLGDRLQQSIGVTVQAWDLASRLGLAESSALGGDSSGGWAVALGLALRPLPPAVALWPGREAA